MRQLRPGRQVRLLRERDRLCAVLLIQRSVPDRIAGTMILSNKAVDINAAAPDGEPAAAVAFDLEGAWCCQKDSTEHIHHSGAEAAARHCALLIPILVKQGA